MRESEEEEDGEEEDEDFHVHWFLNGESDMSL